jgi:uncharacterized membrane protein YdjX (TVP38/TMEM64 family)
MRKEHADAIKGFVLALGFGAPLVFIVLQVLQVVIVPIPGQVIGFVAGYVFGWKLGVIYTMIGLICGSSVTNTFAEVWSPVCRKTERRRGNKRF